MRRLPPPRAPAAGERALSVVLRGDFAWSVATDPDSVAGTSWAELTQKQQKWAEKLGFTVSTWESEPRTPFRLAGLDQEIYRGQKVAIVGPVGCGKSSLLHAMLGEMDRERGAPVEIHGSLSYVAQTACVRALSANS